MATPRRAVLVLSGMLCGPPLWAGVEPALAARAALTHVPLDVAPLEAQVEKILTRAPARFTLLGLSLGGIVAMAVARRAPERVQALALVSTNPRPPTPEQRRSWGAMRERLAAGATPEQEQQRLLPLLLTADTLARRPAVVETVLSMASRTREDGLRAQLGLQESRVDERPALDRLRCPTLVLAAQLDALCGLAPHEEIASAVPGAELAVVADSGHLSPLEAPEEISRLLTAWWDR